MAEQTGGERYDLVLRAERAVLGERVVPLTVAVRDGRIAALGEGSDQSWSSGKEVVLTEDEVLLPGLVDTHVHVNEPGRTAWEGFGTATRAAAAGGITTLVDMPLNSIPPTVDTAALATKRAAAQGQCTIDVGFWGGAVPGNAADLPGLHAEGVFGFKAFLIDSGVPEFPPLDAAGLEQALRVCADLGALLIVHAEDPATVAAAPQASGPAYADFVASRPPESERRAIADLIQAVRRTGARAHLLHLSDAGALPLVRAAREEGLALTVETCPHYLTLSAEDIPDGLTTAKCCPPIRHAANREALWDGLAEGLIDVVVSDHSPSEPVLKQLDTGDFGTAWGGVSSLQLGLSTVWTVARDRGVGLPEVVRWMGSGTADLVGLADRGRLAVGAPADLVVFADQEEWTVDPAELAHRHPISPYAGARLRGRVRSTWLRGEQVGDQVPGRLIRRGDR